MKDFQYYSCPIDGTVILPKGVVYLRGLCEAGCGKTIVYLTNLEAGKPKVCYECTEWLSNTEGNA